MKHQSPRDVFLKSLKLQFENVAAQADLFAENGVMEFPFTPKGNFRLEGREKIRQFLTLSGFSSEGLRLDEHKNVVVRETQDPEVIVVEYSAEVTNVPTGKKYSLPCIKIIQVRDGQMMLYRDYANPILAAQATNTVTNLIQTLTDTK